MKIPINDYAMLDLNAPTLPARELRDHDTGVVRWVVWCRYCNAWHEHGAGEGHREAHCNGQTPYVRTGYNLASVSE